jgi:hypothetical protein
MTSFCNNERISSGDSRTAIVDRTQTTSSGGKYQAYRTFQNQRHDRQAYAQRPPEFEKHLLLLLHAQSANNSL